MSMNELKLSFPTEKLEALRFFMGKKEQGIEKELQDYLDKIYEKQVPPQVRDYVESRMEQTDSQGQEIAEQQTPAKQQASEQDEEKTPVAKDRSVRSNRQLKEQAGTKQTSAQETSGEMKDTNNQEEGQGMSMGM